MPFNVRQADRTLLLARGQIVGSADPLKALFERGMPVGLAELQSARERMVQAPAEHCQRCGPNRSIGSGRPW